VLGVAAMSLLGHLRPYLLDWAMREMADLRAPTLQLAEGRVLEIGFGTGLNLPHYGQGVKSLTAIDPHANEGFARTEARVAAAPFPVERYALPADSDLPFDDASFDTIVSTWTLCSIPDLPAALLELRRLLRPGGHFVFIEHGRAEAERTARWQDRLNPFWRRFADGCNMNRPIDRLVAQAGFRLACVRFRHKGPALLAQMFQGVAERAE
jgi:SAM-dependent methyltransferase